MKRTTIIKLTEGLIKDIKKGNEICSTLYKFGIDTANYESPLCSVVSEILYDLFGDFFIESCYDIANEGVTFFYEENKGIELKTIELKTVEELVQYFMGDKDEV